MASMRPTYLVGFSPTIDSRPVYFVEPLPDIRYCCLCNAVPQTAYFLECCHSFCKSCYNRLLAKGTTCPIDAKEFDHEFVRDIVFTPKCLARTKVRCQNWNNGCAFVGNVLDMMEHFLDQCAFHVVTCRLCDATVRKDDMLDHYMNGDCKVKEQTKNFPHWALSAGTQPREPTEVPGMADCTLNTLSINAASTLPCAPRSALPLEAKNISTYENEGRQLLATGELSPPEELQPMSEVEEERLRAKRSHLQEPFTWTLGQNRVFEGDLRETCEDMLSQFQKPTRESSKQGTIYVGPSPCPYRDSHFFMIGSRCACIKAFVPGGNANMTFYLAIRKTASKEDGYPEYQLTIKCPMHRYEYCSKYSTCTCVANWFSKVDSESGRLCSKPGFDIIGCAHASLSVSDLQKRNCVKDDHIIVTVTTLRSS